MEVGKPIGTRESEIRRGAEAKVGDFDWGNEEEVQERSLKEKRGQKTTRKDKTTLRLTVSSTESLKMRRDLISLLGQGGGVGS